MNILLIVLLAAIVIIPLWALFGSGSESEKKEVTAAPDEKTFRRRSADKDLEKEFPDETSERRGRDERRRRSAPSSDELMPAEADFKLPYSPTDVIPENSAFDVYRRTLKNADVYMQKGDFDTARSIYEGVLDRVGDSEVRDRLEENLSYMNNYHQILSKRAEVKKQQAPPKAQEIRLTLEGADTLADRLQIGIAPEKPPLDVNEIVERISEKLTAVAPDAARIAENSMQKYRDELQQVKSQLQGMTAIREQLRRMNEEKISQDMEQIQSLKGELSRVLRESEDGRNESPGVTEDMLRDQEERIRSDIRQREDENRLLRDRLEMMKEEVSRLKEDSKKTGELEQKIERSLSREEAVSGADEQNEEISRLKSELTGLRQELKDRSAAESASMRELAESMKQTLGTMAASQRAQNSEPAPVRDDESFRDLASTMKQTLDTMAAAQSVPAATSAAAADGESIRELAKSIQESAAQTQATTENLESLTDAMKEGIESLAPILQNQSEKAENALAAKKLEDEKKDDFELIDEFINGPKYDEPSDDDVMEKILNDAMREQNRKEDLQRQKETAAKQDDKRAEAEQQRKEEIKNDFELVSDYMRGPEEVVPADEEVMEKILADAMKGRDLRGSQGQLRQERGFEAPQPQRRRKELPILRVSYNFSRLPDEFTLSTDKNYLEFSFYKYKPLLEKAADLVKRRKVKDAVNYYKVVMDQEIPPEFKEMLGQNIHDLNEYLTKYYTSD
jgi:hypothetical protein